ncbi:hypothetical protein [Rickettsia australis]|uniref:Uncharacterized protein n=1 Tax=Rickettsia australis (strain Cutlack) TaxID=1105110 RepID=H8K6W9_RICAC|nr:hypothetical protein [Rickettsia australis]AFC71012.1 hypothetical protein MC5_03350 [Rickettsia australis str. Cutlack]
MLWIKVEQLKIVYVKKIQKLYHSEFSKNYLTGETQVDIIGDSESHSESI